MEPGIIQLNENKDYFYYIINELFGTMFLMFGVMMNSAENPYLYLGVLFYALFMMAKFTGGTLTGSI